MSTTTLSTTQQILHNATGNPIKRHAIYLREASITGDELQVLRLHVNGLTAQQIAEKLEVTHKRINILIETTTRKLKADHLIDLKNKAISMGIATPGSCNETLPLVRQR